MACNGVAACKDGMATVLAHVGARGSGKVNQPIALPRSAMSWGALRGHRRNP